jgi:cysteine-rich repeat protein
MYAPSSNRRAPAIAATLLVASLGLGMALPAHADVKASRSCRKTIATEFQTIVTAGLKDADGCHKAKDKICTANSNRGACNLVSPPYSTDFDPKGKYAAAQAKADDKIDGAKGKCLAGDPVLANFQGGDADAAFIPKIDEDIAGLSNVTQGTLNQPCGKAASKCRETIAKWKTKMTHNILKMATQCQAAYDGVATTFGAIDPNCLGVADPVTAAQAAGAINKDCAGITGDQIGVCTPLPTCVTDNAKLTGLDLAQKAYQVLPAQGPVCGNGIIEGTEQCDHGAANGTPGDTCNAACERLDQTCTVSGGSGHRKVTVSINSPTPLAGLDVVMDYPQFEAGIPGTGSSNVVQQSLHVIQPASFKGMSDSETDAQVHLVSSLPTTFTSGPLFDVTFDNCVQLSQFVCTRSQNIYGCCSDPNDPNQFQIPPGSEICAKKACATTNPGTVCTSDAQCGNVAGDCQGVLCAADPSVCNGNGTDAEPQYGVCVFKCIANPPVCAIGHFPAATVGTCDNVAGACPSNNDCFPQIATHTCQVSGPVDDQGQPVAGVTCSVNVVEVP